MGVLRNKRKEFKQYAKNHTKNYLYASEFSSDLPSAKMFEHIDIDKMCDVFLDFIGIKMLLTSSMKDLFENFMCSHCWVRHKDFIKINNIKVKQIKQLNHGKSNISKGHNKFVFA